MEQPETTSDPEQKQIKISAEYDARITLQLGKLKTAYERFYWEEARLRQLITEKERKVAQLWELL